MKREHPDPSVRAKFLTAWDLYYRRYPKILKALEDCGFDMKVFHPTFDWSQHLENLAEDIEHFKNAGKELNKQLPDGLRINPRPEN